ncbi:MAG TPA: class I SAM-dependent methyltransferase [Porticoccaceae bacterium]|nr:class I SAM-dependent methyltransferase [Porticoccaceae bacterium]
MAAERNPVAPLVNTTINLACSICNGESTHAFRTRVLRKYDVDFFQCVDCGYLRTPEPHWLKQAYSNAIAVADTGVVQRNTDLGHIGSTLLYFLFPKKGKFLDQAGGYGIFVRMMRDIGFDFYWADKYCENLFARGFEFHPGESYTAVTAFEVLEHVSDPVVFIQETLAAAKSDSLIFTTELFKGKPPEPGQWWYYAFETGQHISFYEHRTLEAIAKHLGKHLCSNGSVHMLTDKPVNSLLFRVLTSTPAARVLRLLPSIRMSSLTMPDHLRVIKNS